MLMFVGTDTTSYTISRSMIWLSKYPEWLKALNDEQDRLVAEYGPELSREVCLPSSLSSDDFKPQGDLFAHHASKYHLQYLTEPPMLCTFS
jgi:cytochrome P450